MLPTTNSQSPHQPDHGSQTQSTSVTPSIILTARQVTSDETNTNSINQNPPMPLRTWRNLPPELHDMIYSYTASTLFNVRTTGQIGCNPALDRADFVPEQPWPWWTASTRNRLLSPLAARLERLAATFYLLSGAEGEERLAQMLRDLLRRMISDPRWVAGLVGGQRLRESQWWRNTNEHADLLCDFMCWLVKPRLRWTVV